MGTEENEAVVDHQEMASKIRHGLGELVNQNLCKYKFVRKLHPVGLKECYKHVPQSISGHLFYASLNVRDYKLLPRSR
jgi:hypothetical protein